jgi:cytochrome P450
LNHDPDIYGPDAKDFRPERHLDKNGQLKDEILGSPEGHFTYGFGQRSVHKTGEDISISLLNRICVGRHVANNSLFIIMATILWTMRLEGGKDSNGKLLVPDVDAEEENGILV